MPNGAPGFLLANYASGKRRFDSYASEAEAIEAANKLARQLSTRDTKAATLTENQAVEYVRAAEVLQPFHVSVGVASEAVAACLKAVGEISALHEAVRFYVTRRKSITPMPVADVLDELLKVKETRGASEREQFSSRLRRR